MGRYLIVVQDELESFIKNHVYYSENTAHAIEAELMDIVDWGQDGGYLEPEAPPEGFFSIRPIPADTFVVVPRCPECDGYVLPVGYPDAIQGYKCTSCGNTFQWGDVRDGLETSGSQDT